jgi:hypothetical protein
MLIWAENIQPQINPMGTRRSRVGKAVNENSGNN